VERASALRPIPIDWSDGAVRSAHGWPPRRFATARSSPDLEAAFRTCGRGWSSGGIGTIRQGRWSRQPADLDHGADAARHERRGLATVLEKSLKLWNRAQIPASESDPFSLVAYRCPRTTGAEIAAEKTKARQGPRAPTSARRQNASHATSSGRRPLLAFEQRRQKAAYDQFVFPADQQHPVNPATSAASWFSAPRPHVVFGCNPSRSASGRMVSSGRELGCSPQGTSRDPQRRSPSALDKKFRQELPK